MTAVVLGTVPEVGGADPSWSSRVRRAVGTAFLLLSLTVFAGSALLPHLGLRLLAVESGSMAPELPTGSLLLERQVPLADLTPGMVLTFYPPTEDQRLVTHRVVAVDRTRGGTIVETRGDANPADDPWEAELLGERAWVVTGSLPVAGRLADVVRSPAVLIAVTVALPVLFLVSTLRAIWCRPAADTGAGTTTRAPSPRPEPLPPLRLTRRGRIVVRLGAVLLAGLVLFVGAGLHDRASAAFSTSASRGHAVGSAVLLAPSVSAAGVCRVLGSTIQVSWTSLSAGEASYRVERRIGSGAWTTLTTVPRSTTTYSDAAVTYLTNYTYRVTGLRGPWTSPTGATPTATLGATCR
jgi:signal peptidase I